MITTEFYDGQGLGNQLWSYASLVAVARRLNYDFGFQSLSKFKGLKFFELDYGKRVYGMGSNGPGLKLNTATKYWFKETTVVHPIDGSNITGLDSDLLKIKDRTKIDGYFQSEDLILPIKSSLTSCLQIPNYHESKINRCVINLRGGEYVHHPKLFLGFSYYRNAIKNMLQLNPKMEFAVVTDDILLAKEFFPEFTILSEASKVLDIKGKEVFDWEKAASDFGVLQSADYLILSNSSFSWWGAWSNLRAKIVIAPKYWARHNDSDGYWSLGDSLTRNWLWQDIDGNLQTYEECINEKK
jgi:hypothetical protein